MNILFFIGRFIFYKACMIIREINKKGNWGNGKKLKYLLKYVNLFLIFKSHM